MTQVLGSRETWTEFPAVVGIWGVNEWMEDQSVSLCLSNKNCKKYVLYTLLTASGDSIKPRQPASIL